MVKTSAGASATSARKRGGDGGADPLLIVGIGASAGGLEAFSSFFGATPPDTGMAFVLVQHLSPNHKSMLSELLGKTTAMSVIEAVDGVQVTANCIYVIAPDSTLTIKGGRLNVERPAPPREHRRPIDTFFQSLAEDQEDRAIAVVLAGTGSDGSLGLGAIKEHGGFTLAQAEFDSQAMAGMPESATLTGQVDDVLAVEAMPARLLAYKRHQPRAVARKVPAGAGKAAGSDLSKILAALRTRTGHDFSEYKEKTLGRRLLRRMQVAQVDTPEAYLDHCGQHPDELDLLFRELLIGVTEFFRDPAHFEALASTVLTDLVAGKGADDEIRIWVPGCSTGQEAYTIAILLREAMYGHRARPKVQIFGTDIDDRAIAIARAGKYRRPVAGLSPERAERWFTEEGGDCCVQSEIHEMCVFSVHSIIKNPPFSRLDLVSCRNLLIYLDADMQDRVMRTLHYALKPKGKLFLGSSETVTRATKLFGVTDKKHRIFERRDVDRPALPDLKAGDRGIAPLPSPDTVPRRADDRIDKSTRRATEKYNPPHVAIDNRDRIVRFSGPAMAQYVEVSPGAPTFALFDNLRKSLRPAVRALLKEARATGRATQQENVPFRLDDKPHLITLTVEPLEDHGGEVGFIVLVFQDAGPASRVALAPQAETETGDAFKALEQDLRTTRAQLQSTIDELETANEELKSSNEEYQSVNEELQSSNEEMETSKEEMQSINEEIQTINSEKSGKNEQLIHLNSDLKNLLESTEIATLFLDLDLKVKSFTPRITELFHIRDSDVGRPITEVVNLLSYTDLQRDARTVLRKLSVVEREVELHDTKSTFTLRIRPYRTIDNVIDGVVMTFIDITERHVAEETLRASEAKFRMLFEFIDEGFCILEKVDTDPGQPSDYRYLSANPGFEKQSGITNVIGKTIRQVVPGETEDWFKIYDAVMATGTPNRFVLDLATRGRTLELFAFRFEDGGALRLGVIFLDISQRKFHEDQQELLLKEMDHRVKNLFAVVGGIVNMSARTATTTGDLAEAVQGRLVALSGAHQLIRPDLAANRTAKRETTLGKLVQKIMLPYADPVGTGVNARTEIDGPDIAVGSDSATNIALVLHELATNAAKYGALSVAEGHVRISWTIAKGRFILSWREIGGPPITAPPKKTGFGSDLARRSVSGQLAGDLIFHWNRDGLVVLVSGETDRLAL